MSGSQCTYRCVVLPDAKRSLSLSVFLWGLNAPTGAWCSLTWDDPTVQSGALLVSMHLQVRGAP